VLVGQGPVALDALPNNVDQIPTRQLECQRSAFLERCHHDNLVHEASYVDCTGFNLGEAIHQALERRGGRMPYDMAPQHLGVALDYG
jgi:hypothetical protein